MNEQATASPPPPKFLRMSGTAWIFTGLATMMWAQAIGGAYRNAHSLTYPQWQSSGWYLATNAMLFAGFVPFGIGIALRWRAVSRLPEEQRRRAVRRLMVLAPILLVVVLVLTFGLFVTQPR